MVTGSAMSVLELVENILQRPAVRKAARSVVFGAKSGKKLATFTIGDGAGSELVDASGKAFVPASNASVVVVHPIDLPRGELTRWRGRIAGGSPAPFQQLDRPTQWFASATAMAKSVGKKLLAAGDVASGAIHGLLALGWVRGPVTGGIFVTVSRQLDGLDVILTLEPGVYAGRGMARRQHVTKLTARGRGSARALSEIARELATLLS